MIPDSLIAAAGPAALEPVQTVSIPIPADIPLSDVLVTTWSDYTLVCCLVYTLGLCMGAAIWEIRRRRILQRQAAHGR
jgi:hypothetical protein